MEAKLVEKEESHICAVSLALRVISKKWTMYIICELLMNNELYFSELQENILGNYNNKISARVLSENLNRLVTNEIVVRKMHSEQMPIRVSYTLTEKGEDFAVIFSILKGWGFKWGGIEQKLCKSFACVHNSVPVIDIDDARRLAHQNPVEE